jgi:toxin-antitoxin system PIN domain toxin
MSSLGFPDVNVWLALLLEDHVHRSVALRWWRSAPFEVIAFSRFTQMSVLRLLTTPAVMNDRPLTMAGAWKAYDKLFGDGRVALVGEPVGLDAAFREHTSGRRASPKLWADSYLLAFARAHDGVLVSFDKALASRSSNCLLLAGEVR